MYITVHMSHTGRIGGGVILGSTHRHIIGGVGITVGIRGLLAISIMEIPIIGLLIVTMVAGAIILIITVGHIIAMRWFTRVMRIKNGPLDADVLTLELRNALALLVLL
jgi:hypothetical protein